MSRPLQPPVPVSPFAAGSEMAVNSETTTVYFGTPIRPVDGPECLVVHSCVTISKSHALSLARSILNFYSEPASPAEPEILQTWKM